MKKEKVEEVVDEISVEEFEKLSDSVSKIDYEEVWNRVKGRILSSKGLEKEINKVRVNGERELYYSEKKRILDNWRKKGRIIEEKVGYVGNRRVKFYKFVE